MNDKPKTCAVYRHRAMGHHLHYSAKVLGPPALHLDRAAGFYGKAQYNSAAQDRLGPAIIERPMPDIVNAAIARLNYALVTTEY